MIAWLSLLLLALMMTPLQAQPITASVSFIWEHVATFSDGDPLDAATLASRRYALYWGTQTRGEALEPPGNYTGKREGMTENNGLLTGLEPGSTLCVSATAYYVNAKGDRIESNFSEEFCTVLPGLEERMPAVPTRLEVASIELPPPIPIPDPTPPPPAALPLSIVRVTSEETVGEHAPAASAIDGNPDTYWHSKWLNASPLPSQYEIVVDTGSRNLIQEIVYLPRQAGSNGRLIGYEVYVSESPTVWGQPVHAGTFDAGPDEKHIELAPTVGRYVRLLGTSFVGGPFMSVAELQIIGVVAD